LIASGFALLDICFWYIILIVEEYVHFGQIVEYFKNGNSEKGSYWWNEHWPGIL